MEIEFFEKPQRSSKVKEKLILADGERLKKMSCDYENFGFDYFDNKTSSVGYGGYVYDGKFKKTVRKMIERYSLKKGDKVLEIGCAKGFLLVEFKKQGMITTGVDISKYAVLHAHPHIKNDIRVLDITKGLPFKDNFFDFVVGKETLPHLHKDKIELVTKEVTRCSKNNKSFLEIQCGRTDEELEYLYLWDNTHKISWTPKQWLKLFEKVGYKGDYHFKILIEGNGWNREKNISNWWSRIRRLCGCFKTAG